ncbi:hypothetical protein FPOA_05139 [Fusarium poae]|uniref:Chromo domain-containing protein n=1 Tax=Fusarium poae TaxID=36050 RepID=A0A1B8AVP1_FUSPO|nr:hypothetical protein FPOA_05139 [Fusarium poae]
MPHPDAIAGGNNDDGDRIIAESTKSDSSLYDYQSPFITGICEHMVNTTTCTVELNTMWSDAEWSWIPEFDVQKSVPDIVYHRDHTKKFLCQWVGYPNDKKSNSWEKETKVRQIAPEVYHEWVKDKKKA